MSTEMALELKKLIMDSGVKMQAVSDLLDGLPHDERVAAVRSLCKKQLSALWTKADLFGELTLDFYVPAATPPMTEVRHFGKNSLPMFTIFEKRFFRLNDTEIGGANFNDISWLTGPGYYVAAEDKNRKELVIDYRKYPDTKPEGWPKIKSNTSGISTLVYGNMVDITRRVSAHVSIGSATNGGKDMGAWFMLCRDGSK
ncbi:MAG: hypothetical protein WC889_09635 [Myxococcota bacterium]|jgi:hypothetical protein